MEFYIYICSCPTIILTIKIPNKCRNRYVLAISKQLQNLYYANMTISTKVTIFSHLNCYLVYSFILHLKLISVTNFYCTLCEFFILVSFYSRFKIMNYEKLL